MSEVAALVMRASGIACALPAMHVIETMRRLPIAPLDDMPPFSLGVATIRGAATPVVSLGALLGQPETTPGRLVTVRAGTRVVALAVDEVLGLERFENSSFAGRAPILSQSERSMVRSLTIKDNALYLVLDAARIVDATDPAR